MPHVRATDAPEFVAHGTHHKGLATPQQGSTEVTVVREVLEPGAADPPHQHDREEVVVVVSGEAATATIGDEDHALAPRDAVIIPPHTTHQLANTGAMPLDTLATHPAGTRYLRPDGDEAPSPPWTQ